MCYELVCPLKITKGNQYFCLKNWQESFWIYGIAYLMLTLHNPVGVGVFEGAEPISALKATIPSIQNCNGKDCQAGFWWCKPEKVKFIECLASLSGLHMLCG